MSLGLYLAIGIAVYGVVQAFMWAVEKLIGLMDVC